MKSLLSICFLLLGLHSAAAREIVLAWDPNPPADEVTEYRVYEMTGAGWALLGSTETPQWTVGDREPGYYEFAVTAVNYWGESVRSESASTPPGLPTPPAGPHIEGARQVAMEVSEDLETWRQVAVADAIGDREFWRVRFQEDGSQ